MDNLFSFQFLNAQQVTLINVTIYQLKIINYQLSIINYQLSKIKN